MLGYTIVNPIWNGVDRNGEKNMQISEERRQLLMKNNEQAKLNSQRCIKTALLYLLKQKKYDDISMSEIIRKSGVSRMGVYNNYKNKDEILIDLYRQPLEEIFTTLGVSIYANLEWIFSTAYRHKEAIRTLIDAGLAYTFLSLMNERFENTSKSFYIPLWNGMIYNAVIEWVKSDTDETPENAAARMSEALKMVAESIETGKTNPTQNAKLK